MRTYRKMKNIIDEATRSALNENFSLRNECNNIQSIIMNLEEIYDRVFHKGLSSHEISMIQIKKMIKDLGLIKKHWQTSSMW